jgi:single-strand DNA-binding protein
MSFELQGKIYKIGDVQTLKNDFTKREFVVETEETYPQKVNFELVKDKTVLVNGMNIGDKVKVSFNVRGSEWQGRFFVNLSAWKVEAVGAQAGPGAPPQGPMPPMPEEPFDAGDAAEDDLPF